MKPGRRREAIELLAALAAAYGAFAATFRGPRHRFWHRMTMTGAALGSLSLLVEPDLGRLRPRVRDLALGLGSAAVLYEVFQAGDRFARRAMPRGAEEIGEVYELRELGPRPELAARLALVVAPAEELFWRGLVQGRLGRRYGRWRGAALASVAYAGAHVSTGNLTLVGAAGAAGAFWSALRAAGMPIPALVASHIAWDLWIFLVAPTHPPSPRGVSVGR
jgi:membrane protease YdiL (CAAX protease family)